MKNSKKKKKDQIESHVGTYTTCRPLKLLKNSCNVTIQLFVIYTLIGICSINPPSLLKKKAKEKINLDASFF